jgi:asparagine synthase (glutamine-hydrolysing)
MLAALGIGNAGQWAKVASAGGVRDLRDAYLVQRAIDPDVPSDGRCGLPEDTWGSLGLRAFDAFRNISALEVAFYLRSQLLHDADVFSSANSVELRVPFLDLGVLRAAWCTPAAWHRGRYGGRKQILKALLRRLAPGHPVGRAKMGFVFPWTEWLRGPLGERVAATLADRTAHARLDLAPDAGLRLVDAFRRGDPRVGWAQLWSRFVLVEWHRETALDASTVRERRIA